MTAPAPEQNPAAVQTAGLEIAVQRQREGSADPSKGNPTTAVGAVEKAAPILAEAKALVEAIARIIEPEAFAIYDADYAKTKSVTDAKMGSIRHMVEAREKASTVLAMILADRAARPSAVEEPAPTSEAEERVREDERRGWLAAIDALDEMAKAMDEKAEALRSPDPFAVATSEEADAAVHGWVLERAATLLRERIPEAPAREPSRAWRFDVENAPRDRMIDAVGRYPEATAGFPVYVGWQEDGWYSFSRNEPERMVIWAWRERPDWPREPASE